MKKIVFTRSDGGLSVLNPCEGARLATKLTLADGTVLVSDAPKPVDQFRRGWPIAGAVAEWAETEDEFVARIAKKDVPADATDVQTVDESAIPTDRTFRNAWKHDGGGKVVHDMDKARELKKDQLRVLRKPLLADLDVAYMLADEKGDTAAKSDIAKQKQALRDVTDDPAIEAAATPEELKAAMPAALAV